MAVNVLNTEQLRKYLKIAEDNLKMCAEQEKNLKYLKNIIDNPQLVEGEKFDDDEMKELIKVYDATSQLTKQCFETFSIVYSNMYDKLAVIPYKQETPVNLNNSGNYRKQPLKKQKVQ